MANASGLRAALKELGGKGGGGGGKSGGGAASGGGSPIDDFMALERSNGVRLVLLIDQVGLWEGREGVE